MSLDARDLKKLKGDFEDIMEDAIKETALEMSARIVKNTPVDTGLARANWQVTSKPTNSILPLGNSQQSILKAMKFKVGKDYYITNNLDYVYWLNYGSSKRAGDFFVESAIRSVINILNRK